MSLTCGHIFNGAKYVGVEFRHQNDFSVSFSCPERSLKDTKELFSQLASGKRESIEFEDWNGFGIIELKEEEMVSFSLSKYERQGTVEINLSLPLAVCLPMFGFLSE
nr:hypothetical protein MarQu_417 [Marseillevirus sp.]